MAMPFSRRSRRRARGGYLYVSVLLTSLVVSTMGLVALSAAALRLRSATDANDWAEAQILAQSAIDDVALQFENDTNWRSKFELNVEYPAPASALGNGTFTWKLVDDDGDLDDDDSDSVRVIGIGRVGRATAAQSVRLLPSGQPLTCLESALHCQGDVTLGSTVVFTTDKHISSNGNIAASSFLTSIQGSAQAVGTVTGTINGVKIEGAPARRMPGSSALDYYVDNGTMIAINALPLISGAYTIEKQILSPQVNPFGNPNPEGIYVIDCGGQRLCIKNCRIVGTIVLLNPAANSSLEGSLRWDTAVGNYPALLVAGTLEVKATAFDLSESLLGVNFNPPGVPYQANEDTDLVDNYPAEINGLVYFSGRLNAPQDLLESRFRGVTVCATISANSSCRFNYRPLLFDYPPPGFASGNPMRVSPGSRRRESLP